MSYEQASDAQFKWGRGRAVCPEWPGRDSQLFLFSSAGFVHLGIGGAEHTQRGAGGLPATARRQSLGRRVRRTKVRPHALEPGALIVTLLPTRRQGGG